MQSSLTAPRSDCDRVAAEAGQGSSSRKLQMSPALAAAAAFARLVLALAQLQLARQPVEPLEAATDCAISASILDAAVFAVVVAEQSQSVPPQQQEQCREEDARQRGAALASQLVE